MQETRHQFRESLRELETQALGGLDLVIQQLDRSLESISYQDVELAQDLVRQDAEINRLNRDIFKRAVEVGDDLDVREWAMFMILVARCLERIGDNTVDIAEQVVFVVTGLFREFADASSPPPEAPQPA